MTDKRRDRTIRFRKSKNGRSQILFNAARTRGRKLDIPFTITREWLDPKVAAGVCEATGMKFDFEPQSGFKLKNPFSPSLDRADSTLGYTPENTRVVSTIYNYAKNEWTEEAVAHFAIMFLKKWSRKHEQI